MNKNKLSIVTITFLSLLIGTISSLSFAVPATATFSNDIVGQWHFDEGKGDIVYDSSGFDNDGTRVGATWTTDSVYGGWALEFDGTNYVNVPNALSLNIGKGTWEAWIKFNKKPSEVGMMNPLAKANQYWIHASNGADDPFDLESITFSDSIQVKITVGGTRYIASTEADFIEKGVWYHVVGTYDGETLSLYVNGELIDTNTFPSGNINLGSQILAIGTWSIPTDYFQGVVDEVRVWSHVLSDVEIKKHAFGLVGEWYFDEGSGSMAFDTSGFGNHGSLFGDTDWVPGKYLEALSFDGIGDYVMIPDSPSLEPKEITVEAWVKSAGSPGTYRYIVSKYLPDKYWKYSSYGLYTGISGGLWFYIGAKNEGVLSPDAGTTVWDGNWHHVAGTFDGSNVKLYVDGAQIDGETSTTQDIYYHSTGDLFIGGYHPNGLFFFGIIDEVRIWNKALIPIKFDQTGLDDSAMGTVLTISDPISLTFAHFPYIMMVESDTEISYCYTNPVPSTDPNIKFWLSSVDVCDDPISVAGNYFTALTATIDFNPNTLNCKSKGNWVTVYIELPEEYDVNDIDLKSIKLNSEVPAEIRPKEFIDYDEDGICKLMVKFNRSKVCGILESGENVEINISGSFVGNTNGDYPDFIGTDTIRVIEKNKN